MTTETKFKCTCPSCDKDFYFSRSNVGKKAKCSKCDSIFRVTPDDGTLQTPVEQPVYAPVPPYEQAHPHVVYVHNNYQSEKKSKALAFVLWFLFGGIGLHRFYTGDYGNVALILGSFALVIVTLGGWIFVHVPIVLIDGVLLLLDKRPNVWA